MNTENYTGRFAPSPTGAVHFGTLIAAVASYLQAKKHDGRWLLRMEDVDTTRKLEGADADILKTLESFAFEWDGEVVYQTHQTKYYEAALEQLAAQSRVFPCQCTRKQLAETGSSIYPGTCRERSLPEAEEHAIRLLTDDVDISFHDRIMGEQRQNIARQCGDFVIKRRDGLFAYQLAVVVDDAMQGVTEIVRGADLLDSTPRQIYLQKLLAYATPAYYHLPLAVDACGNKISKSQGAAKVELKNRERQLLHALQFLGQHVTNELIGSSLDEIWLWAIEHWDTGRVPATRHIPLSPAANSL